MEIGVGFAFRFNGSNFARNKFISFNARMYSTFKMYSTFDCSDIFLSIMCHDVPDHAFKTLI